MDLENKVNYYEVEFKNKIRLKELTKKKELPLIWNSMFYISIWQQYR